MGKQKSIGMNAVLNVIRQCLSILFPLITYPYALRMLGAESIGKVNYGQSIINYCSLIAMLGVSSYVVREGAKEKNNREEFEEFASQVFSINIIFTVFAYILLMLAIVFIPKLHNYWLLLALQSISILLNTLGIDWINTIFEDYLMITVRSIVTHIFTLVLLFVFVHSPEDYYIYALLNVASNGVVCISNWFYCGKYANIKLTRHLEFKTHIKPLVVLFANSVAITIYTNFDITMLGWMKGDYYVGLYSVAVRIYTIIKNILAAIFVVAIPRLSYYVGKAMFKEYRKLYSDLWGYMSLLLIPTGIGLICIAPEIMFFIGGEEFIESTLSLQILAGALICAIFGGLITNCLNIVFGREKDNLKATVLSACMNFALNLIFIPLFSHYGSAFTTLISELVVFVFCFIRVPNKVKYIDFRKVRSSLSHSLCGSAVMFIYAIIIRNITEDYVLRIILIVPGSIVLYTVVLFILKDPYLIENMKKFSVKISRR